MNSDAMENTENKPKNKIRIYEDQTQIQQFVEPEWMKILRVMLEQKQLSKTIKTINTSKDYDKRY